MSTKIKTTVTEGNPHAIDGGDMTAPLDTADSDRTRTPNGYAEDFPDAVAEGVALVLGKPRARGWIHFYSAVVAVIAGAALVAV